MKCLVVILSFLISDIVSKGLREEFTWSRLNYVLPRSARFHNFKGASEDAEIVFPGSHETTDGDATSKGRYIYENNIPMGANVWKNKLFITVPRRRAGVPSTLNYVLLNGSQKHNVPLVPYPDWDTNQLVPEQDGERLVSVYRTAVDSCDRLWMVDTGRIEIPGNNTQVQSPGIVIIDLNTDMIIKRYTLKDTDVLPTSTLASLVIDVSPNNCNDAYAYIPDLSGYGLVVYSLQNDNSWRVTHNYFYLEPLSGEFYVGGVHFQWNDGIFSLGLSEINPDGYRTVYFHSMAGTHIYSVSTRILKNSELATRSYHDMDFKVEVDRAPGSQTSASDLHKPTGVLFLALVNQNALGCWNTRKGIRPQNFDIVHKDDEKFIYPSDVKIYGDEVIVLSNTMPVFLYSRLNYDETNFRVWIASVSDAVKDTSCSVRRKQTSGRPSY